MLRLEILSSEDSSSCQQYFEGKMAIYPVFGAWHLQAFPVLRSAVEVIALTDQNIRL